MDRRKLTSGSFAIIAFLLIPSSLLVAQQIINLNITGKAELQKLYRVGPILAERMVLERELNGPFKSLEDVSERVKGVGPVMIARWADIVDLPYSGSETVSPERMAELRELELMLARGEIKLDLNSAPGDELQLLYKVGPTIAERIVEEREANGLFISLKDLEKRVKGVGNKMIEEWSGYVNLPRVTIEELPPETIDINYAGVEELDTLYRVGPILAQRIVKEREENGPFASLEELCKRVKGLGPTIVGSWRETVVNPLRD